MLAWCLWWSLQEDMWCDCLLLPSTPLSCGRGRGNSCPGGGPHALPHCKHGREGVEPGGMVLGGEFMSSTTKAPKATCPAETLPW